MALAEVKKFIAYIKQNRESLEKYNERLWDTGSYMFMDPSLMSESYPPLTRIPENPEDDILEEIINLKDKGYEEKEKEQHRKPEDEEKLSERIVERWDGFVKDVVFDGKKKEDRIAEKQHRLFKKLAEIAKDENFEITQDDLEYYVGKLVGQLINENPEDDSVQILEKLLDRFIEE